MPPLAGIAGLAAPHHLEILGGFNPDAEAGLPAGIRTVLLLGPSEPGFWPHVMAQPEFSDGRADPLDRWSRRVIGRMACALRGKALFPFGGPPFRPFFAWALRTGRIWQSPVRLAVHDGQGLLFSCRGALALKEHLECLPPARPSPCVTCDAPCTSACPVGAMGRDGYDTRICHQALEHAAGAECLAGGCLARRACPISQSYARLPEQSAWHMRQFHP